LAPLEVVVVDDPHPASPRARIDAAATDISFRLVMTRT